MKPSHREIIVKTLKATFITHQGQKADKNKGIFYSN